MIVIRSNLKRIAAWLPLAAVGLSLGCVRRGSPDGGGPDGGAGGPAQVKRGPYLQAGTPTSVVVRWRTRAPIASRVRYGTNPTGPWTEAAVAAPVLEHELTVPGLVPATKYAYALWTEAGWLSGEDVDGVRVNYDLITPPLAGMPVHTRVWAFGDSGNANMAEVAVKRGYEHFSAGRRTDVWLLLGDGAYEAATDDDFQHALFDMFRAVLPGVVLWPTVGNHDVMRTDAGACSGAAFETNQTYMNIFSVPSSGEGGGVGSGTKKYYSFDHGDIHFVSLDSSSSDRAAEGPMLTWLEADLHAARPQRWLVAFWHHPPYSKGTHDSDRNDNIYELPMGEMRSHALPILERHGVDLVLTGHSHNYERSHMLHGHYGKSWTFDPATMLVDSESPYTKAASGPGAGVGTVYVVSGAASMAATVPKQDAGGPAAKFDATPARDGGCEEGATGGVLTPRFDHPAMPVSLPGTLGTLVFDIDGDRLDARFVGDGAGTVKDSFTIIKQP